MIEKHRNRPRHPVADAAAVLIMAAALFFCFSMILSVNQRMNESAASNLLNTTRVIEGNLENYFEKDFETLKVVGELHKNGVPLNQDMIDVLRETMQFEWIAVTDAQGNGADHLKGSFKASGMSWYPQWIPETTGFSDAYYGESGRLQTTLWTPVYRDGTFVGTVFGNVILSKYYSANVFTFYEGAGRTYLFDGENGKWILKSLGSDGTARLQDDIYSLLLGSGNAAGDVDAFRQAVEARRTGSAVFTFNGERSHVCFMPLTSSPDWYVVTVIAGDVLLKESRQVQRMIQTILFVFCIALMLFAVTFTAWRIRSTKTREARYREALFANISSNIDAAFLIYEKSRRKTAFVSDNVKRLLGLERNWLEADAANLFDWCQIEETDRQRADFLAGTLDGPAAREVCVENELGVKARYFRLELIPADLGQEIAVLTDITKDRDVQNSLMDAMQRAEAASRAKNDFLSAMSHDIRTPMNGVIGMTAIAAVHLDDKARVKDCLTKIHEASVHLLNLINEILDMSRIESGKMELTREPFNLAELLQDALSLNYPGIRQKNHSIQVHIHSLKHEQVIGDPVRLQRIVDNLLSNAIKYTPEGGAVTLSLRETPSAIRGYGCYEILVQDNGIGMSREFQQRIFQPFEREENVRLSKIQGTGLGMSIVKNIVALMMGDIQVESEKNKGSTFRVTFHLQLDAQENAPVATLERLPVLVVDDNLITCETVTGMLHDIGMIGEWADNGALAVKKVVERHERDADYMAVLLDWKMPGMDGIETARRIRAQVDAKVPIIILTAYDWSEIETEAREAGVDAFLSKPLYKTKLRRKLLSLTDGSSEAPRLAEEIGCQAIPAGKRILLVEDNELNMEIAGEILQMMNLEIHRAADGLEALEMFSASKPGTYDLILMDIQMPKMNGYDATRAIRKLDRPDSRAIPIVAMTADAFVQDVQAAHVAGMDAHIAKPISIERLTQVLISFLSGADREPGQEGKTEE